MLWPPAARSQESMLQRVQEDLHQLFSQEEAWQRDSTHRWALSLSACLAVDGGSLAWHSLVCCDGCAGLPNLKAEWQRWNEEWMPFASPSLTVSGPALKGAGTMPGSSLGCWPVWLLSVPPTPCRVSALERAVEEGLAEQDRSLQLVVQRLEETTREAEKEQERLAAALQAVAEGAQRELSSAEDRLLSRLQRAELHWEEVSSVAAMLSLQSLCRK